MARTDYVYTVWFRDPAVPVEDEDHEWPACFIVRAHDDVAARAWGDHLAASYAERRAQVFSRSSIERADTTRVPGLERLPVIDEGREVEDDDIGW